jgi:hypothetical protein
MKTDFKGIQGQIDELLEKYENGYIVIDDPATDRFIQFSKETIEDGRSNFIFDFPFAPWSDPFFDPMLDSLDKNGKKYRIEGAGTDPEYVTRFLQVWYIKDSAEAMELVEMAMEVMKIDKKGNFEVEVGEN